jgi:hypothetical protein
VKVILHRPINMSFIASTSMMRRFHFASKQTPGQPLLPTAASGAPPWSRSPHRRRPDVITIAVGGIRYQNQQLINSKTIESLVSNHLPFSKQR